jgi:hypothetical protein
MFENSIPRFFAEHVNGAPWISAYQVALGERNKAREDDHHLIARETVWKCQLS